MKPGGLGSIRPFGLWCPLCSRRCQEVVSRLSTAAQLSARPGDASLLTYKIKCLGSPSRKRGPRGEDPVLSCVCGSEEENKGAVGGADAKGLSVVKATSVAGSFRRPRSHSTALGFCPSPGAQVHGQWLRGHLHTPLAVRKRALLVGGLVPRGPKWRQRKPKGAVSHHSWLRGTRGTIFSK